MMSNNQAEQQRHNWKQWKLKPEIGNYMYCSNFYYRCALLYSGKVYYMAESSANYLYERKSWLNVANRVNLYPGYLYAFNN